MAGSDRAAEVRDRVLVLDQHRAEAVGRRVALDDERPAEVRERQDRGRRDRGLESRKRRGGLLRPCEALLLEQCREGSGDFAVAVDELAVVARKP